MSDLIEERKQQLAKDYHQRMADAKHHQEQADDARYDAAQISMMLAVFKVTSEDHDEPLEASENNQLLQVPHRIDVGALAANLPRLNPFREAPDSPAFHVWEVMQDGSQWHVIRELAPRLAGDGHRFGQSGIYKVLRDNPTVFERTDGLYRVTSAYRNRPPE